MGGCAVAVVGYLEATTFKGNVKVGTIRGATTRYWAIEKVMQVGDDNLGNHEIVDSPRKLGCWIGSERYPGKCPSRRCSQQLLACPN